MSLQGPTQSALQVALGLVAGNDVNTNINTPTPSASNVTGTASTTFTVAAAGTNYIFQVDTSTASAVVGIKVKGAAAGGGVAISVIGGNAAESVTIDARGAGNVTIGGVSTGVVSIGRGSVSVPIESSTETTVSTNGALTISAAALLGGFYLHTGTLGLQTTDTAANIKALIPGLATGDSFMCTFLPTGADTLAGGSGVTLKGSSTLAAGKAVLLIFTCTNAATPTFDLFTVVSA